MAGSASWRPSSHPTRSGRSSGAVRAPGSSRSPPGTPASSRAAKASPSTADRPAVPFQTASTAIAPGDLARETSHSAASARSPRGMTSVGRATGTEAGAMLASESLEASPAALAEPVAIGSRRSSCLKIRSRGPRISSSSNRLRISSRLERPSRRSAATQASGTSRTNGVICKLSLTCVSCSAREALSFGVCSSRCA